MIESESGAPIRVERRGPVTTVILDRPGAKNAVDRATVRQKRPGGWSSRVRRRFLSTPNLSLLHNRAPPAGALQKNCGLQKTRVTNGGEDMTLREYFLQRHKAEAPVFLRVLKALPKDTFSKKTGSTDFRVSIVPRFIIIMVESVK